MAVFMCQYDYLFFSGLSLVLFFFAYLASPSRRGGMLRSAWLAAPIGFASVFFVPDYWNPRRLFTALAGIEDIIFSFATGGLAWWFACLALDGNKRAVFHGKHAFYRLSLFMLTGQNLFVLAIHRGMKPMDALFLSMLAVGAVFWKMSGAGFGFLLAGGAGFAAFYGVLLEIIFRLSPGFLEQWNLEQLWGVFIGRVPLEEILWALGLGILWPMAIRYVFQVRIVPAGEAGS
jgi:hypothetical protein